MIVLFVLGVGFLVYKYGNKNNWNSVSLSKTDDDPYGALVLHKLLDSFYPEEEVEYISKKKPARILNSEATGNYLFLNQGFHMDSTDFDSLLSFVERGNRALIISSYFPHGVQHIMQKIDSSIMVDSEKDTYGINNTDEWVVEDAIESDDSLSYTQNDSLKNLTEYQRDHESIFSYEYIKDTTVRINLVHQKLKTDSGFKLTFRNAHGSTSYWWHSLPSEFTKQRSLETVTYLGTANENKVNFFKLDYGKGSFYFHTEPIVFSNYFLKQKKGIEYASGVFSHLKEGTIYVDEYSNQIHYQNGYGGNYGDSLLRHFLRQPSLAWAWYLGLVLVLLYVVFQSKRKQRIVPFIPEKRNISLEYAKSIGRLYFLRENHHHLAKQKVQLFSYFMMKRYSLTLGDWSENHLEKIELKTKRNKKEVNELASVMKYFANTKYVDERDLHRLERAFRPFYSLREV